jgi:hypothetical protein
MANRKRDRDFNVAACADAAEDRQRFRAYAVRRGDEMRIASMRSPTGHLVKLPKNGRRPGQARAVGTR